MVSYLDRWTASRAQLCNGQAGSVQRNGTGRRSSNHMILTTDEHRSRRGGTDFTEGKEETKMRRGRAGYGRQATLGSHVSRFTPPPHCPTPRPLLTFPSRCQILSSRRSTRNTSIARSVCATCWLTSARSSPAPAL